MRVEMKVWRHGTARWERFDALNDALVEASWISDTGTAWVERVEVHHDEDRVDVYEDEQVSDLICEYETGRRVSPSDYHRE